ncbi:MAG: hypothetical protein MK213_05535 [Planctomycetes bacterium]|nr:hypothetical protein [Planctomycetota bacterium]
MFRDAIQSEGFDAWSEHGRRKPIPTFPAPAPVGALDKMFWRGTLLEHHFHASKLKLTRVASDHLPLVGEFDVVTESRTAKAR